MDRRQKWAIAWLVLGLSLVAFPYVAGSLGWLAPAQGCGTTFSEGLACALENAFVWLGLVVVGLIIAFCAGVSWMYLRQQDTALQGPKP